MKKLCSIILALTCISANVYAANELAAATNNEALEMNDTMKQFSDQYAEALNNQLKMPVEQVVFIDNHGVMATVIKYHGFINLRQSRVLLMNAVDLAQKIVQDNPQFQTLFPNNKFDLSTANIVIDNYDEKAPKESQGGISSVVLVNGWVQFNGISQRNGSEILLHKEPLKDSQRIVNDQTKRK